MTDTELVEAIKIRLSLSGEFHDGLILGYISDVKEYLIDAGVKESIVNSEVSVGVISRGVADLWNFGSGEGKFSEVFYQRAIQLCYKKEGVVNE